MKSRYDIVIIGGGVIGCSIARALSRYKLDILLLERGPGVAWGISRANSGVIHAGYANKPGSLKARLCVQGNSMFDTFASELNVPFRRVGKLVVGNGEDGLQGIERLMAQGDLNGVPGLSTLSGQKAIRSVEPNLTADHAMVSTTSGITDPVLLTIALAENAHLNGVDFLLESEVTKITGGGGAGVDGEGFTITTPHGPIHSTCIINSAGMHSDRISAMAGDNRFTIHPCRGEYFVLDKSVGHLIGRMIYPVPPKDQRVLGIHLTPTIDGNILIGPSAEFIDHRDDLATTRDVMQTLLREAKDLLPPIPEKTVIQSFSGLRPKLNDPSSPTVGDFIIEESPKVPGLINLLGIESPGLTSSPILPSLVIDILRDITELREKDSTSWNPGSPSRKRFAEMKTRERATLISGDSDHGHIVCRCEHVTKREVEQALDNPLGGRSLMSVKMRTRATMGRCQGGFCTPRIIGIMQERGINPDTITLKGGTSSLFLTRAGSGRKIDDRDPEGGGSHD